MGTKRSKATAPAESIRGTVPGGVGPVEPTDAGGSTPRTVPPVYPTEYATSTQPNAPELPWPGWADGVPAAPVATSIAPTSALSGASFTITGTGFVEGTKLVSTLTGANFAIVSLTSITVDLSGTAGAHTVGVSNAAGTSALLDVTITV